MIAGDVEARMRELREAAADAARATVTALDRLILADRVCKALQEYRDSGVTGPREGWNAVEEALDAWEKGQPS